MIEYWNSLWKLSTKTIKTMWKKTTYEAKRQQNFAIVFNNVRKFLSHCMWPLLNDGRASCNPNCWLCLTNQTELSVINIYPRLIWSVFILGYGLQIFSSKYQPIKSVLLNKDKTKMRQSIYTFKIMALFYVHSFVQYILHWFCSN